ncbi:hypothetical protein CEXT_692711 [Caerostris extrusa]|uniref:Uncharacterized protein n=1 Tax=Caerostris extrusa TaxID=172846 RepID=A0AAV4QMJ4_CAEEX|nr:hypothetical protein CEXT_692711 [Caerostris extrusa]
MNKIDDEISSNLYFITLSEQRIESTRNEVFYCSICGSKTEEQGIKSPTFRFCFLESYPKSFEEHCHPTTVTFRDPCLRESKKEKLQFSSMKN